MSEKAKEVHKIESDCFQLVGNFCIRKILDETIAVPTGEAARKISGLISLNDVGEFLFERLQTSQTKESLVAAILDEYETDEEVARSDVESFLKILEGNELLRRKER